MAKQSIFFRQSGVLKKLNTDEIILMEAADNYVKFYLDDRTFTVRITLSAALKRLPAKQFLRVHRSFAVSVDYINEIAKDSLLLRDVRAEIPVSKEHYPKIIKQIVIMDAKPPKTNGKKAATKTPLS